MKKWTRKKSLWPILCFVSCLLVLAIVAPQAWHRYQTKLPHHEVNYLPAEPSETVVTLTPEPQVEQSVLLSPAVASEFAEPPIENKFANENKLVEIELVENVAAISTEEKIEPTVPPAPAEVVLAQPKFDFDVLLQVRDTLVEMVDRLPRPSLPVAKPQARVRVSSETDRLAMLDRSDRHVSNWDDQNWATPAQAENVASTPLDSGIVEELLKAARQPEPQPLETPQVALSNEAPSLQVVPAPVVEPTPAPALVPLPPITETVREQTPPREPLLRFRPTVLFEQLDLLTKHSLSASWSEQVHREITLLSDDPTTPPSAALSILEELGTLAASGRDEANQGDYSNNRHLWLQAIHSLERRLAIWHALLDPAVEAKNSIVSTAPTLGLLAALGKVGTLLQGELHGDDWRDYLMLDEIVDATSEGRGFDLQGRSKLAQAVMARMNSTKLSTEQKAFLATKPLADLRVALQPWAATSVNLDRLAALIERYESGRELRFGVAIAQIQQQLRWSNVPQLQALAEHLDLHYRGSNMRLAITDDLMNQMMPEQKPVVSPVYEHIAGADVRGKSRTTTTLQISLIPDSEAWRLGFEASGNVYSNTRSETWPARVRNAAKMQYQTRKTITISREGLHISRAQAEAQGRHELLGVDSQLDGVPLLGTLLRDIARNKNQKSRSKAMSQVKQKVIRRAQQRMDDEADQKFKELEQKFRAGILGPIEKLALLVEPRSMFTTEDRAVMQLRLANEGQLAAHTPRPLAPSDSVASLQMHETVLNNALAGLQLDGRRMKVVELFEFFNNKFSRLNAQPPADLSQRAVIQFAKRDAVLVSCEDDRVELILNIREVAHGRDKIRNFQVHAYFRPVLDGLDVRLVRDGTIHFFGRSLKTGARVVLQGVFGKLMDKDTEIKLLAGKVQADPRLEGLMVTQLVIDDGWIGLALGPAHPNRTAWRSTGPNASTMMR